jgi:hypothetical protein
MEESPGLRSRLWQWLQAHFFWILYSGLLGVALLANPSYESLKNYPCVKFVYWDCVILSTLGFFGLSIRDSTLFQQRVLRFMTYSALALLFVVLLFFGIVNALSGFSAGKSVIQ